MREVTTIVYFLEPIYQEMKHETIVVSTSGLPNGEDAQEQNGIGLSTNQCKQCSVD